MRGPTRARRGLNKFPAEMNEMTDLRRGDNQLSVGLEIRELRRSAILPCGCEVQRARSHPSPDASGQPAGILHKTAESAPSSRPARGFQVFIGGLLNRQTRTRQRTCWTVNIDWRAESAGFASATVRCLCHITYLFLAQCSSLSAASSKAETCIVESPHAAL